MTNEANVSFLPEFFIFEGCMAHLFIEWMITCSTFSYKKSSGWGMAAIMMIPRINARLIQQEGSM
jgi:hypothetical protein